MTLGNGHNQIKIILTTLNEIFSYIQRILLCGIFNFRIPRMLEAFRGVFDEQLPILDVFRTIAQQIGVGTNTIELI